VILTTHSEYRTFNPGSLQYVKCMQLQTPTLKSYEVLLYAGGVKNV